MAVLVLGSCSSINFFRQLEFVLNLSFYPPSLKLSLPIHGYEVGCCDSTVDSYKTNGYFIGWIFRYGIAECSVAAAPYPCKVQVVTFGKCVTYISLIDNDLCRSLKCRDKVAISFQSNYVLIFKF